VRLFLAQRLKCRPARKFLRLKPRWHLQHSKYNPKRRLPLKPLKLPQRPNSRKLQGPHRKRPRP
jgi:hypothetical protein